MTGYQAAMGRVQLRKIEATIDGKRRLAQAYNALLADVPGIKTPVELEWARNVYWMYAIEVGDEFPLTRDELSESLYAAGIESRTFFCPISMQPFLRRQEGFNPVDCPVAERLWRTGLYLPSTVTLTEAEISTIADRIRALVPA
jgi:perosamine synthetase